MVIFWTFAKSKKILHFKKISTFTIFVNNHHLQKSVFTQILEKVSQSICECIVPLKKKMGSNGLVDKVSASQPRDHGFEPHAGHDHDSSYDTSTG